MITTIIKSINNYTKAELECIFCLIKDIALSSDIKVTTVFQNYLHAMINKEPSLIESQGKSIFKLIRVYKHSTVIAKFNVSISKIYRN